MTKTMHSSLYYSIIIEHLEFYVTQLVYLLKEKKQIFNDGKNRTVKMSRL